MELAVRFDGGGGSPVVLLHGFPGNGSDWVPAAQHLSERHRAIVVDLLGFGSSPTPERFEEMWVEAQARALARTLERLDVADAAIVGHDMGGPVAVTFFRLFPDRVTHLGLLSTNTFADTPVDFPLSLLRFPLIGRAIEPVLFGRTGLNALGRMASKTSGVRPARNDSNESRVIRTVFARVLRDLSRLYAEIERSLPAIDVPTVVIWGDQDMFFTVAQGRRTAGRIPGAEFVVLDGCGHFPPIERTETVVTTLLDLFALGNAD